MTFAGLPACDKGKVATASLKEQADPECCIEGDEAQLSFARTSFRSWPLQIKVRGRWNAELPESKSSHGHEIGIRCLPYHLLRSTSRWHRCAQCRCPHGACLGMVDGGTAGNLKNLDVPSVPPLLGNVSFMTRCFPLHPSFHPVSCVSFHPRPIPPELSALCASLTLVPLGSLSGSNSATAQAACPPNRQEGVQLWNRSFSATSTKVPRLALGGLPCHLAANLSPFESIDIREGVRFTDQKSVSPASSCWLSHLWRAAFLMDASDAILCCSPGDQTEQW
jgi:hypothetical protein